MPDYMNDEKTEKVAKMLCNDQEKERLQRELEKLRDAAYADVVRTLGSPPDKPTILSEAQGLITGDRNKAYGSPSRNHTVTADLWEAYLRCRMPREDDPPTPAHRYGEGFRMTAYDVCVFNMLQKISRLGNQLRVEGRPHRDSLVDIAGYAGNMEMIQNEEAEELKRRAPKTEDPRE